MPVRTFFIFYLFNLFRLFSEMVNTMSVLYFSLSLFSLSDTLVCGNHGDLRVVIVSVNTFYWRMGHIMDHTTVDDPVGPLVLAGVLVRASVCSVTDAKVGAPVD
jgi:hypothetical protein